METINSYPQVYAVGHRVIKDLFVGEVAVEEKIDGSQFSMGVVNGELCCRSKGKQIILDAPEKMFTKAIETATELKDELYPGGYTGVNFYKSQSTTFCFMTVCLRRT